MSTVSVEWQIEPLEIPNDKGQAMSKVTEIYIGGDRDPRTFMIPSTVAEALVRTRRAYVQRIMSRNGGIKLLLN